MTRRAAVGALIGMSLRAAQPVTAAVVLDTVTGRAIDSRGPTGELLAPPGSTLKPLLLSALLDTGKLRPNEAVACTGGLTIEGRSFACVHPRMNVPVDLPTAIAYSCNEYVARVAQRFTATEQRNALRRYGLSPLGKSGSLQALGEDGVKISVLELAAAYRMLASKTPASVLKGLEDAVEFGTAQNASVPGVKVAGKTGSSGNGHWAWFAGFAPSVQPRFVVAVLTQGASGGADAAPIAAELLRAALKRRA